MYAIIQAGSAQFRVSEGDVIEIDRVDADKGKDITLDQVLLLNDGSSVQVGRPFIKGAKIKAKVVDQTLGDKTIAFKYRRRKDSATKVGHRQKYTAVSITKISA